MEDKEYQAGESTRLYHNAFLLLYSLSFLGVWYWIRHIPDPSVTFVTHIICLSFMALYFIFFISSHR